MILSSPCSRRNSVTHSWNNSSMRETILSTSAPSSLHLATWMIEMKSQNNRNDFETARCITTAQHLQIVNIAKVSVALGRLWPPMEPPRKAWPHFHTPWATSTDENFQPEVKSAKESASASVIGVEQVNSASTVNNAWTGVPTMTVNEQLRS